MQPTREVTRMLLLAKSQEYERSLRAIEQAAIRDGEAPSGSQLNLLANPPHWILPSQATTDG